MSLPCVQPGMRPGHPLSENTHAVPLEDAAVRTLEAARDLGGERFVFSSPVRRGSSLEESSFLHLLHKADLVGRTTVQGFHSSFRSWAGECTDADHAVMELCLAATGPKADFAACHYPFRDERPWPPAG